MYEHLLEHLGQLGRAVLDSSSEGILLADLEGNIVYTNKSYTQICMRNGQERIGQNILKTNPYGALTEVLLNRQPVFGKKHNPPGAHAEVLSNAFPIYIDNQMVGAIVFFREVGEALKILEDLAKAREDIRIMSNTTA